MITGEITYERAVLLFFGLTPNNQFAKMVLDLKQLLIKRQTAVTIQAIPNMTKSWNTIIEDGANHSRRAGTVGSNK